MKNLNGKHWMRKRTKISISHELWHYTLQATGYTLQATGQLVLRLLSHDSSIFNEYSIIFTRKLRSQLNLPTWFFWLKKYLSLHKSLMTQDMHSILWLDHTSIYNRCLHKGSCDITVIRRGYLIELTTSLVLIRNGQSAKGGTPWNQRQKQSTHLLLIKGSAWIQLISIWS